MFYARFTHSRRPGRCRSADSLVCCFADCPVGRPAVRRTDPHVKANTTAPADAPQARLPACCYAGCLTCGRSALHDRRPVFWTRVRRRTASRLGNLRHTRGAGDRRTLTRHALTRLSAPPEGPTSLASGVENPHSRMRPRIASRCEQACLIGAATVTITPNHEPDGLGPHPTPLRDTRGRQEIPPGHGSAVALSHPYGQKRGLDDFSFG